MLTLAIPNDSSKNLNLNINKTCGVIAVNYKQHFHVCQPFLGFALFWLAFLIFCTVVVECVMCDAFRVHSLVVGEFY